MDIQKHSKNISLEYKCRSEYFLRKRKSISYNEETLFYQMQISQQNTFISKNIPIEEETLIAYCDQEQEKKKVMIPNDTIFVVEEKSIILINLKKINLI